MNLKKKVEIYMIGIQDVTGINAKTKRKQIGRITNEKENSSSSNGYECSNDA